MKQWFFENPDILHIDCTYKVNCENFVLCNFLVQNKRLKGLPVAFAFMRQETNSNYEFTYQNVFSVLNASLVNIIMVDKDLQNLDLLRTAIPNAELLICTFHVLKYLGTRICALETSKNKKAAIKHLTKSMVYVSTQIEYEARLDELRPIDAGFTEYWLANWDNCK